MEFWANNIMTTLLRRSEKPCVVMANRMFLFLYQCKEMIRIVKVWSNSVAWRNSSSTPSQYLLSLLVTAACQVVLGIEYVSSFAAVGSVQYVFYKIHNF